MAYLVLVRHGRSEWNDKGLWTGWTNISLTDEGREEAKHTAKELGDIKFDCAFTSALDRAIETTGIILKNLNLNILVTKDKALNERSYGIYTGKNKWEVKEQVGEEEFKKIRRSWDYAVPEGESLKQVYERAVPFYEEKIKPEILEGKNVLVGASGNSLRALVKYLENIPDDKISDLEIATGEALVYEMDKDGKIISKEVRSKNEKKV